MTQKEKLTDLIEKARYAFTGSESIASFLVSHGVVVREKGEWIEENGIQICPFCGEEHEWEDYRASFCDQCGAEMREEKNDE